MQTRSDAQDDSLFLRRAATAMLVFTVFAFAQKLVAVPETIDRYTPRVAFHAAVMVGWLALYLGQAMLAARGGMALHRVLGVASAALVAAILWSGFAVSRAFTAESGMLEVFLANLVQLSVFGGFWAAAVAAALSGRLIAHRQLMLIASLSTLSPPISRVTQTLFLPNGVAAALHVAVVMAVPVAYDLLSRGRVSRLTLWSLGVIWVLIGIGGLCGLIPPLNAMVRNYVGL